MIINDFGPKLLYLKFGLFTSGCTRLKIVAMRFTDCTVSGTAPRRNQWSRTREEQLSPWMTVPCQLLTRRTRLLLSGSCLCFFVAGTRDGAVSEYDAMRHALNLKPHPYDAVFLCSSIFYSFHSVFKHLSYTYFFPSFRRWINNLPYSGLQ